MPSAGFEIAIPTAECPQTYVLRRTATAIFCSIFASVYYYYYYYYYYHHHHHHHHSQHRGYWGTQRRSWLRHCAKNRKVAGSIPDGVIGIFH